MITIRARPGRPGYVGSVGKLRYHGDDIVDVITALRDAGHGAHRVKWTWHESPRVDQAAAYLASEWRIEWSWRLTGEQRQRLKAYGGVLSIISQRYTDRGVRMDHTRPQYVYRHRALGMVAALTVDGVDADDRHRAAQALATIEDEIMISAIERCRDDPSPGNIEMLGVVARLAG